MDIKNTLLFGGSFNPPHLGHLGIVKIALSKIPLDEVIVMPCYQQPLKDNMSIDPKHRINMLNILFDGVDKTSISTHEIDKNTISYTIDTIREIKPTYLLVGMDSFLDIKKWKNYEEILSSTILVVVMRGFDYSISGALETVFKEKSYSIFQKIKDTYVALIGTENYRIVFINAKCGEYSSTYIRNNPKEPGNGLNNELSEYILENKLYIGSKNG